MSKSVISEIPVKARLLEVDLLKGIAIILVILGHVLQYSLTNPYENPLFNFIYSFHMPLFIFISGFLSFKDKCSLADIKKRAYQLLPPFLLWPAIRGFIFNGNISVADYALLFKDPSQGLWFLWILFLISSYFTLVSVLIYKVGGGQKYLNGLVKYYYLPVYYLHICFLLFCLEGSMACGFFRCILFSFTEGGRLEDITQSSTLILGHIGGFT